MIGLTVVFAHVRPGDDFHYLGERYCKLSPHNAEALATGTIIALPPEEMVVHATDLPLYTLAELSRFVTTPPEFV